MRLPNPGSDDSTVPNRGFHLKIFVFLSLFLIGSVSHASKPVMLGEAEIFKIYHGVGAFSLDERLGAIEARIESLAKNRSYSPSKLKVDEFENSTNVLFEDRVIITITDNDAKSLSVSRQVLGNDVKNRVVSAIDDYRKINSWKKYGLSIAYVVLSTVILIFLLSFISKLFPSVVQTIQNWSLKFIPSIRIKSYELLPASRLVDLTVLAVRSLRVGITLLLLYLYIPLVFSFFPYTSGWADKIFGYVANPLKNIAKVVVDFIPNLFFIGVIVILTSYVLKFLKFIFSEIERGSITFSGFHQEWASPTYKLIRFLVFAFALVIIFPYLPGSGSPAFQGVSVFLGVLLSFGSSSAISNIVAGVVLTYMRPFKVGDRVKIADTVGNVVEKSLLVTRVRTNKNVDVTIPSSMVLGSHLVNYSSSAQEHGLILHSTVTIGYDIDWRTVHELLVKSASSIEHVKSEPKPFVLQTSLDDFYVSYEINAYTDRPNLMPALYSELHKNIQESFKEAGVEIMSPHFSAIRDGSQVNIPTAGSPQYVPAIRVSNENKV